MFCTKCGAELTTNGSFCPYCGTRLETPTVSSSLISKAISTADETNQYNLVLVSKGSCDAVTAGDLLEDVFGYTDAESGNLVKMAPVVVAQSLTQEEATTIAQMFTEYGVEVSITDQEDQFVDMPASTQNSVFDGNGKLLAGVAAVVGALTVANRISSYRRFRRPSLLDRIFRINYKPAPPVYQRYFRPRLDSRNVAPRVSVRRPPVSERRMTSSPSRQMSGAGPHGSQPFGGSAPRGSSHGPSSGHSGPRGRH